jgi:hypothetical protein
MSPSAIVRRQRLEWAQSSLVALGAGSTSCPSQELKLGRSWPPPARTFGRVARPGRVPCRDISEVGKRLLPTSTGGRGPPRQPVEDVSQFLDRSSLAVTTTYLRGLEGQEDRSWRRVSAAIGV